MNEPKISQRFETKAGVVTDEIACHGSVPPTPITRTEPQSMLPAITQDIEQAKSDIAEYGLALLANQLNRVQLQAARAATYHGAEEDVRLGREADKFGLDYGTGNVRVWNILNRHPVFCDMVQAPRVLALLEAIVGWPALLGNISANIAEPGSDGGAWHQM